MQTSSVSALESPGAPRAALYSAVGVGLWKSPTPPRRIVGPPSSPPPPVHMKPMPGERRVMSRHRTDHSARSETPLPSSNVIPPSAGLYLTIDDFDFLPTVRAEIPTDRSPARPCAPPC